MAAVVALIILALSGAIKRTNAQVDPSFALSHGCDATCQFLTDTGLAFEASQHATINDSFYSVPSNFSSTSKPGSVLSIEVVTNLTNYTVPSGLTMSRFIYTTTNLNGTSIPASAYVLWPYTPYTPKKSKYASKDNGIPMVAWAHGTTGSGALCSPSNYQSLQYNFIVPYPLALAGFAVVAPDYAGLGVSHFANGTRIPHAWLSSPSQANDLANAVLAAHTAFPSLSKRFVVMGHSQGGAAAYAFAQRQAIEPVSGYLGTVAIAPLTANIKQITAALDDPTDPTLQTTLGFQQKTIAAITADYPAYNYSGMTEQALERWEIEMQYSGCLPTESLLWYNTTFSIGKPGWVNDSTVQAWAARTSSGGKPLKGPLLVLGGEIDDPVPLRFLESAYRASCQLKANNKESLEMVVYNGLNHFPLIDGSQRKWMDWIKARFDGEVVNVRCSMTTISSPRISGTKQSILPNWLLQLPGPLDVWKASL
jgi:pimeloyl-ACP methyl ester carboxylesterase